MKIEFPCGRITLEGVLGVPEGRGPFPLVAVCHPHPLYGGSMDNNVVDAVCAALGERGVAWLKFNFRGVGRSGGSFGGGEGEKEDARAALSFGEGRAGIDPGRMGLCGYSFGSQAAFRAAAEDPRVKAVAGISPFVQPEGLLDRYLRPKLLACGTADPLIPVRTLEALFSRMPEPKELALFPGVDHFWAGREGPLGEKAGDFFRENL